MKCKNCGEELDENMAFCTKCGTKVEKEEPKKQEEIAVEKTETQEDIVVKTPAEETTPESKPEKDVKNDSTTKQKKSKKGIIIAIILVIVIAIAGWLAYAYTEEIGPFAKEEKNDEKDKENTTAIAEDTDSNEATNEREEVDKTVITEEKQDFKNGLAWSKINDQLVCINTEGKIVFRAPEEYNSATNFDNEGYALIKNDDNKAIIDKEGNIIVTDKDNSAFDEIISEDVIAGCAVVYKNVDTYEKNEKQYGIIGFEGNWILELSADNDFLSGFTTGLTEGILVDYATLYFVDSAKQLEMKETVELIGEDDTYLYMLARNSTGTYKEYIKIKKDGTKDAETILEDVEEIGNYTNDFIYISTSEKKRIL